MNFAERVDALEGTPAPRPSGCTCPPVVGGWDEECPMHPDDVFSSEGRFMVVEQVLDEHVPACVQSAQFAACAGGVDEPIQVRQIAAEILADGDVKCVCGPQ